MKSVSMVMTTAVLMLISTAAAAQVDLNKAGKLRAPAQLNETAPATYKVMFETSKGVVVVVVHRESAPIAADRFYNLAKNGFYDDARFFRVISGFMAQFGMNGNPKITQAWEAAKMKDEPTRQSNTRGRVTFARLGGVPDSRGTQVFINYGNNARLDTQGFAPFGEVTSGMDVVDKLYSGYGEGAPRGRGPEQGKIMNEGNAYLNKDFPKLDYIKKATIEK